jgi:hypothetical protein
VIFELFFDGVLNGCHVVGMVEKKTTENFFLENHFGIRASTVVYFCKEISP